MSERLGPCTRLDPAEGIPSVPREGTANTRQKYKSPSESDPKFPAHYPDLSAKHADYALSALMEAMQATDSRAADTAIEMAKAWATLSLRDQLDELNATVKECTNRLLDSQEKLDSHIQTAAQHLHKDAHELKAQLRVIRGEAA